MNDNEFLEFQCRLVILMERKNVFQKDIANGAGLSYGTINQLFHYKRKNMYVRTLVKLATYLEVSSDWLLGIEDPNNKFEKSIERERVRTKKEILKELH